MQAFDWSTNSELLKIMCEFTQTKKQIYQNND